MYFVELLAGPKRHRFEAVDQESLLDQALHAGSEVSFACRRGDCGQCAGILRQGQVNAINPGQPVRDGERVYLCNSTAASDLVIELPYFPDLANVPAIRSPAKIHQLVRRNDKVVEIILRLPPNANFRFMPGQFVRLTNKEKIARSYSLAAPPDDTKILRIHVSRVPGGLFSDYLFERAKPGDLLHLEGPQGYFFVSSEYRSAKTFFLATGTGIAPIHAMLSGLSPEARAALGQVDVYWGNRWRSDEYLRAELAALAQRLQFGYWPLHSREASNGARHVQELMGEQHPRLEDASVFACGSVAMIRDARALCETRGLQPDRFHSDPFTGS